MEGGFVKSAEATGGVLGETIVFWPGIGTAMPASFASTFCTTSALFCGIWFASAFTVELLFGSAGGLVIAGVSFGGTKLCTATGCPGWYTSPFEPCGITALDDTAACEVAARIEATCSETESCALVPTLGPGAVREVETEGLGGLMAGAEGRAAEDAAIEKPPDEPGEPAPTENAPS